VSEAKPTKEEIEKFTARRESLLALIADAYRRMATNTAQSYRNDQKAKCDAWLAELTELNETNPFLFSVHPARFV